VIITIKPTKLVSDLKEHFRALFQEPWENHAEKDRLFDLYILESYTTPQRHYHTLRHLWECLSEPALHLANSYRDIVTAIFFHDIIYDPKAAPGENESDSARALTRATHHIGLGWWHLEKSLTHVWSWILHSDHNEPRGGIGGGYDSDLFLDIDLAILGAEPARFEEYEEQIRCEYSHVPHDLYKAARAAILQRFLDRRTIYHTKIMQARYEERARANIADSIKKLR
jgi:predicted metal-dependent HD superfamily phosphohydrolase